MRQGTRDHSDRKEWINLKGLSFLCPESWGQKVKNSSTTSLLIIHTLPASLIAFERHCFELLKLRVRAWIIFACLPLRKHSVNAHDDWNIIISCPKGKAASIFWCSFRRIRKPDNGVWVCTFSMEKRPMSPKCSHTSPAPLASSDVWRLILWDIYGSDQCSTGIIWELVRNANSQVLSQTYWIRDCAWDPGIGVSARAPRIQMHTEVWKTSLQIVP